MKHINSTFAVIALLAAAHPAVATDATGTNENGVDVTRGATASSNPSANFDSSWNAQNKYWRDNYPSSSYYDKKRDYSTYEPAYRYGVDLYNNTPTTPYEDLDQSELNKGWSRTRGDSGLEWNDAERATRDSYRRMFNSRNTTNTPNPR